MHVTSNGYQALWTTMLAVSHMSHSLRKFLAMKLRFLRSSFGNEQKAIVLLRKRDYKKIKRLRR